MMKPSKIRNRTIHKASVSYRSNSMGSHLVKTLREQYGIRSARPVPGDSIRVLRGEYRGVSGKVEKVSPKKGVVVAGTKKEKIGGQKFDTYVHPSNMIITELDTGDKWRMEKIRRAKS